jgi:hypothetical protein
MMAPARRTPDTRRSDTMREIQPPGASPVATLATWPVNSSHRRLVSPLLAFSASLDEGGHTWQPVDEFVAGR